MDVHCYKGYEMHAVSYQLAGTGYWTINIKISNHQGDKIRWWQFSAGNCFKTREGAVAHCFNFGTQIIDGKFENCTLDDL